VRKLCLCIYLYNPKEEYKTQSRDSMNRFKKYLENCDGFIEGYTLEDEITGIFVGMIKSESKDHMENNIHLAIEAIKNDNFDEWVTSGEVDTGRKNA